MLGVLHNVADVSAAALEVLNDLSGFDIYEFVASGDDRDATDRALTDHLDIFISAVVKLIGKGVSSSEGKARVAVLEQAFRSGLQQLREYCVECRRKMRIGANSGMMVDLVNLDLNLWAGRLFDEATDSAAQHDTPPSVEDFPFVVVPAWTRFSQYIGAGGLRNSKHQPRAQLSPPGYSRESSTTTTSGKQGYCFAWASAAGCGRAAHKCRWEHAHDPNLLSRGSKRRGGNHDEGGGGGGGDSAGRRGGSGRNNAQERVSGGGSGGGGGDSTGN